MHCAHGRARHLAFSATTPYVARGSAQQPNLVQLYFTRSIRESSKRTATVVGNTLQPYKVRLLRAAARYIGGRGGEGQMALPDHARSA